MPFDFESLLKQSEQMHGHLCPGQVLGVRMAVFGLKKVGISDPKGKDRKRLIIFVETDRCATDAIQSVSGCSLGHRTLKFADYGKMAATFINLKSGKSIRVIAREAAKGKAKECFPHLNNKYAAQLEAYKIMSDDELFEYEDVIVNLNPEDMPGRPIARVECDKCGEYVQDMREVRVNGSVLCRCCAEGGYYRKAETEDFLLASAMQNSHNDLDDHDGIEIRSKVWLEMQGEPVFGRGRRFLLRAIDEHGSINQAAKIVNVSYKKAWSYIKSMEDRLGIKLVDCQIGGKSGGGTRLTKEARDFLKRYEKFENGINELVDDRFKKSFRKG
jgi:formylmethanofuran dehydrogenase subunit E